MALRNAPQPAADEPADRYEFTGTERFEVVQRLGSGGFGVVFEVLDRERNARVALKALKRDDPSIIYRFKQEFRSLADIVHGNLVQLYELHRHGEQWFFTMELVHGQDVVAFVRADARAELERAETQAVSAPRSMRRPQLVSAPPTVIADPLGMPRSRRPARFDEARLRAVLPQLLEGLAALHDAGKVHRDIKPPNVLVTAGSRVVLVDFGISVSLGDSSFATHSTILGTPAYMAPEQIKAVTPAPAWDMYAVGILLYEALTGEVPFDGNVIDVLSRKQSADPPAPSALVDGVPDDLDRLTMELLSRAPDARPTARALLDRLHPESRRAAISLPTDKLRAPFVGRERERGLLADAYRAARRDGTCVVALVGGPSGVGKSALCRRVREDLREAEPELVVVSGRCYEQESVPYKAVDGLMDALGRYLKQLPLLDAEALMPEDIAALVRLFPTLQQVEAVREAPGLPALRGAREVRRAAFDALRELVTRLGRETPLLFFIDDLQWGDPDSAALLIRLLEPPDPPPIAFVAAYRNDDTLSSACLGALLPALASMRAAGLSIVEVALDNLPDEDARALARALLAAAGDTPDDALVAAVARESGGRPFFVDELARFSGDRPPPSLRPAAGRAPVADVSLDAVVRARVAQLPEPARRLIEVVSVAGRPVDRAAAARAAALGSEEPGAYELLRTQRLLRRREGEGDEIETYHDRIREAVAAGLSPETRAAHFRGLASALDPTTCDAETLAVYHLEAGDRARAAELTAVAAADAARTLAFESAVRLYRRALSLLAPGDPAARDAREGLGNALVNAGRGPEAAEALLAAIDGAGPLHGFELRRRGAEQLLISGHIDRGLAELHVVLAELNLRLPDKPWQAVRWIFFWAVVLVVRGLRFRPRPEAAVPRAALVRIDTCASVSKSFSLVDTVRGTYFAVRHLAMALRAGEPRRALHALSLIVAYGGGAGGVEPIWPIRRVAAAAHRLAATVDDAYSRALLRMCEGVSRVLRGFWREGAADLEAAIVTFREECTGATWEIDTAYQFFLVASWWQGAWREVASRFPSLVADARERGDLYAEAIYTLYAGYVPHIAKDDAAAAEKVVRAPMEAWSRRRFNVQHYYFMLGLGEVHLYAGHGRGPEALRHLDELWRDLERSLLLHFEVCWVEMAWMRFRALVALATGPEAAGRERDAALAEARRIARKLASRRTRWSVALGWLGRATLAALRGDREQALGALATGEEVCAAADLPQYAAAARRRRGELLGDAALVAGADAWVAAQGFQNPERTFAMLTPGWRRGA